MTSLRKVGVFGLALLFASLAHLSQRSIDAARKAGQQELLRDTVPSGPVLRVASSGFHVLVADVLWIRSILAFGETLGQDEARDEQWAAWLEGSLLAVAELDPSWRTPYQWGGLMLEVSGAPQGAENLYTLATEQFPDDYRFWFSLGMVRYFSFSDPQGAAESVARAAECPGAPEWYAMAAIAYGAKQDTEEASILYLQAQLDQTGDPELRARIEERIKRLDHLRLVSQIRQVRLGLERNLGHPVSTIEELESLAGSRLPPDPMGAVWVFDVDGQVRSEVIAQEGAAKDLRAARSLLINPRIRAL
ncbi:MAG: tetratricopeptide (TPR) repeat protein [Cognaticolwellia sp.]|jgi:tetratricopeptide (TPR) repeat protein